MDPNFSFPQLAFAQDPFQNASAPPSLSPAASVDQYHSASTHPSRQSSLRPVSRPPNLHRPPSTTHPTTRPSTSSSLPTSYNPQHPSHHPIPPFSQPSSHEHPSSSYSTNLPPPPRPHPSLRYPTSTTQYNHNIQPQQPSVPCSTASVSSTRIGIQHSTPPPPRTYYNSPPTIPHIPQNQHNRYMAQNPHIPNPHIQIPPYSTGLSSNQMHIPISAAMPNNANNNYSRLPQLPQHMNNVPPQHHYNPSFSSTIPTNSTPPMTSLPSSIMQQQQHHQPPKPAPPGYPSMSTGIPSSSTIPGQIPGVTTSTTSSPSSIASQQTQPPPGYPAMSILPPSMDSAGVGENHDTWSAPSGSSAGGVALGQVDTMDPTVNYPGKKNRWWRRKTNNGTERYVSDDDDSN